MSRLGTFALLAVVTITAGCGKDPGRPGVDGDEVQALPVLQPLSGGEMVLVPAGTFTMGDSSGRPDETPHPVSVSSFFLDRYAVTQELYEKVMGVNPSKRKDPKNPVERTQWTDAARFCNRCSELEGLTPCYDLTTWECNFEADGYRLPTEAEWEYACRAGSTGQYCFGDAEKELPRYTWLKPHSQGKPHPVGQKQPNRWGLYDVHGNTWQWCNDWYGETYYAQSSPENPRGPATGKMRVLRGGAWDCTPEKCRSAYRHKEFPVYSDACFGADSYGFRRARKAASDKPTAVAANLKPAPVANPEKKVEKPAPVVSPAQGSGKIDLSRLKGTIVFVSDRGGVMKIWTMHASGKDAKQLTQGRDPDADPRFSPDGKRILYTTLRSGFPEVWMMDRDGSGPRFVTKGSQASWAPDGKSIIFIQDNQTYVRDLASGQEKRVTPKEWERCGVPAFSPDGRRFAVASRHLGNIGIFILSLDGKENHPLQTDEACCTPQWSKDGKKILCQTVQGHVHQVGVDGKNWEQVTFGADVQHDARYSPDGTMVLFCRAPAPEGPWQICVKRLDGDEEEFVQITREGSNLLPNWHAEE
jgi:formylglycine-generating enzyme required for sulfatase activity/Tol biopolymer transport system component